MVFSCICSCESMRFQQTAPNSVSRACLLKLRGSQKCVLTSSETKPIVNLYRQSALGDLGKGQAQLGICAGSLLKIWQEEKQSGQRKPRKGLKRRKSTDKMLPVSQKASTLQKPLRYITLQRVQFTSHWLNHWFNKDCMYLDSRSLAKAVAYGYIASSGKIYIIYY